MSSSSSPSSQCKQTVSSHPTAQSTAMMNSSSSSSVTRAHTTLYQTLQRELDQMGRSLRCSVCQSTLTDPVLLPCVHVYCRECIVAWWRNSPSPSCTLCPTCKQPASKRSLVDATNLHQLCRAYKTLLQQLGWAPLSYQPQLEGLLTQIAPGDSCIMEEGSDAVEQDNDAADVDLHYQICNTWNQVVDAEGEGANVVLKQERAMVLAAAAADHTTVGSKKKEESHKDTPIGEKVDDVEATGTQLLSQILQDSRDREAADRSEEWMLEEEERRQSEERDKTKEDEEDLDDPASSQDLLLSPPEPKERQEEEKKLEIRGGSTGTESARRDQSGTDAASAGSALLSHDVSGDEEVDTSQVLVKVEKFLGETTTAEATLGVSETGRNERSIDEHDKDGTSDTTTQDDKHNATPRESQSGTDYSTAQVDITTIVANQQLVQILAGDNVDVAIKERETVNASGSVQSGPVVADHEAQHEPETAAATEGKSIGEEVAARESATGVAEVDAVDSSMSAPPVILGGNSLDPIPSSEEEDFFTAGEDTEETTAADAYLDADSSQQPSQAPLLKVGTIVSVQSRTWPGVNKPGGVARIVRVQNDGVSLSYDVAYILGGKERSVEATFVSVEQEIEGVGIPEQDYEYTHERKSRRLRTSPKDEVPETLLKQLASDGFDAAIDVDQVRRSKAMDNTPKTANRKRKPLVESAENMRVSPVSEQTEKAKQRIKAKSTKALKKRRMESGKLRQLAEMPPAYEFPHLDNDEKCQLANVHYAHRFSSAMEKKAISVVASSLSDYDAATLEALSKASRDFEVKIKVTESIHAHRTTVCILPVKDQGNEENLTSARRTVKAMRASLAGIPMVSLAWISSCHEAKRVVVPTGSMYIRTMPTKVHEMESTSAFGVALLAARMEQQSRKQIPEYVPVLPLGSVHAMLCGPFSAVDRSPKRADLQLLVREGGGSLLTSVGAVVSKLKAGVSGSDTVVLLCDESSKDDRCGISETLSARVKHALAIDGSRVLVVNSSWLFDSVGCGTIAPAGPYLPRSPRARALWEHCKKSIDP